MSIMFNEICINEEMLPKYTHTHTHTHTHIYIYTDCVPYILLNETLLHTYIYWIHTDAMITDTRIKDAGRKTQE